MLLCIALFCRLTWRLTSAECSVSSRTKSVKPLLTAMWSAVHMELFRMLTFAPLLNSNRAISAWLLKGRDTFIRHLYCELQEKRISVATCKRLRAHLLLRRKTSPCMRLIVSDVYVCFPLTQRQCSVTLYLHLHPSSRWSHWPAAEPSPPPCGLGVQQPAVQSCPGSLCPPTRGQMWWKVH